MSNRADRRKKKKQQPRWQKRFSTDQRINAMCKNGITPKDVDSAYEQGRKDTIHAVSDYIMQECYAGFMLAAHDVFGFGHDRCLRLVRAADDKIINYLSSDEALNEVFDKLGIRFAFEDAERVIDTTGGKN